MGDNNDDVTVANERWLVVDGASVPEPDRELLLAAELLTDDDAENCEDGSELLAKVELLR